MFRPRRNRYAGRPPVQGVETVRSTRLAVRPSAMIACATAAVRRTQSLTATLRIHPHALDLPDDLDIDPTSALNTTWPSSKRANTRFAVMRMTTGADTRHHHHRPADRRRPHR